MKTFALLVASVMAGPNMICGDAGDGQTKTPTEIDMGETEITVDSCAAKCEEQAKATKDDDFCCDIWVNPDKTKSKCVSNAYTPKKETWGAYSTAKDPANDFTYTTTEYANGEVKDDGKAKDDGGDGDAATKVVASVLASAAFLAALY